MLQCTGKLRVADGILFDRELKDSLKKLQGGNDGEYVFVVVDKNKKGSLGAMRYLFLILKVISDKLSDHPTTDQLYRYFSDIFAPVHRCTIAGKTYEYYDLKKERQVDLGVIVDKIIQYAQKKWNIEVPSMDELKNPENSELYATAYANQFDQWTEFLPSYKK